MRRPETRDPQRSGRPLFREPRSMGPRPTRPATTGGTGLGLHHHIARSQAVLRQVSPGLSPRLRTLRRADGTTSAVAEQPQQGPIKVGVWVDFRRSPSPPRVGPQQWGASPVLRMSRSPSPVGVRNISDFSGTNRFAFYSAFAPLDTVEAKAKKEESRLPSPTGASGPTSEEERPSVIEEKEQEKEKLVGKVHVSTKKRPPSNERANAKKEAASKSASSADAPPNEGKDNIALPVPSRGVVRVEGVHAKSRPQTTAVEGRARRTSNRTAAAAWTSPGAQSRGEREKNQPVDTTVQRIRAQERMEEFQANMRSLSPSWSNRRSPVLPSRELANQGLAQLRKLSPTVERRRSPDTSLAGDPLARDDAVDGTVDGSRRNSGAGPGASGAARAPLSVAELMRQSGIRPQMARTNRPSGSGAALLSPTSCLAGGSRLAYKLPEFNLSPKARTRDGQSPDAAFGTNGRLLDLSPPYFNRGNNNNTSSSKTTTSAAATWQLRPPVPVPATAAFNTSPTNATNTGAAAEKMSSPSSGGDPASARRRTEPVARGNQVVHPSHVPPVTKPRKVEEPRAASKIDKAAGSNARTLGTTLVEKKPQWPRGAHLMATRIQQLWRLHYWRKHFVNFGERRLNYVGRLSWLQERQRLYGTETAEPEDTHAWNDAIANSLPDLEVDPWGHKHLRNHLNMIWGLDASSGVAVSEQQFPQQQAEEVHEKETAHQDAQKLMGTQLQPETSPPGVVGRQGKKKRPNRGTRRRHT